MTTSCYENLSHSKLDCKYHLGFFLPNVEKKSCMERYESILIPCFMNLLLNS